MSDYLQLFITLGAIGIFTLAALLFMRYRDKLQQQELERLREIYLALLEDAKKKSAE